jgi:hypothetical protein
VDFEKQQCPSKGEKYVIDEELQHTDHLFLGVACFTFLNLFVDERIVYSPDKDFVCRIRGTTEIL